MKTITVNIGGYECLFDEDDLWVLRYSISAVNNGRDHVRLVFTSGELCGKYVARVILNTPSSRLVDHINRNPLDNRKSNLRHASRSLNALNASVRSDKKSKLPKGIDLTKNGKYRARLTIHGMRFELGNFDTLDEAIEVYDSNAKIFIPGWHDGSKK